MCFLVVRSFHAATIHSTTLQMQIPSHARIMITTTVHSRWHVTVLFCFFFFLKRADNEEKTRAKMNTFNCIIHVIVCDLMVSVLCECSMLDNCQCNVIPKSISNITHISGHTGTYNFNKWNILYTNSHSCIHADCESDFPAQSLVPFAFATPFGIQNE